VGLRYSEEHSDPNAQQEDASQPKVEHYVEVEVGAKSKPIFNKISRFHLASTANLDNNIKILRKQIGPYLAGLIEGDGTIAVHDPKSKSKQYNPKIIIVCCLLLAACSVASSKQQAAPRSALTFFLLRTYKKKVRRYLASLGQKKNDLPLADYLQKLTKCGTVIIKPERGYVLWQIQDIISIFTIISIINGFMRTPKIEAVNRTIDWKIIILI